jgi:hypothetical protein
MESALKEMPGNKNLEKDIDMLKLDYYSRISHILIKNPGSNVLQTTREYRTIIGMENYADKMFRFMLGLKEITLPGSTAKIDKRISQMEYLAIPSQHQSINLKMCKCGSADSMQVIPDDSELRCGSCGNSVKLYGALFEDFQICNSDGQKMGKTSYETLRHFKFWMQRMQANENKTFQDTDLEKINECIQRDCPDVADKKLISCARMRSYLKETHLTTYNDNVPLLLKLLVGKFPPQLDFAESQMFENSFRLAMVAYELTCRQDNIDRRNKIYIPFFIYKIAEFRLKNSPKIEMLKYIHIQNRDTVVYNDVMWKKMCDCNIMDIDYVPTVKMDDD